MYCIKCGVKLEDTEKKCPLCNTVVSHPDFPLTAQSDLYPENKMPTFKSELKAMSGAIIILFLLPLLICFFSDLQVNGELNWFGYVAGALIVCYVTLALPLWFHKPNPVIFLPCSFVVSALYLHYINWATNGNWYFSFALPVIGGLCLVTCATVSLLHYVKRGRLYIFGGAFLFFGSFMLLIEYLLYITFGMPFIGWSIYPMILFACIGGFLLYLAINRIARQMLERKLFF